MKKLTKAILSSMLALCLLTVPFSGVLAQTAPIDLMPAADADYTIVSGDGTVSVADGKMTIVNNADGDLRITINNTTGFDLTVLHTLHMDFNAEMPFKMAYHIASNADSTSGWLNTSTNYTDLYTIDAAADRAAAGEYDVKMNVNDPLTTITDKSSVYFKEFIILLTGKGTFTLNTVEITDGESSAPAQDESTDSATKAPTTTTTVQKPADNAGDSAKTGDMSNALVFVIVAAAAVGVVTLSVVTKKSKAH